MSDKIKNLNMHSAFARMLRRSVYVLAICAAIVFAIAGFKLRDQAVRATAIEQAKLCAVHLRNAPDGELSIHAAALVDRYKPLIGVAVLDSKGRPASVLPELGGLRKFAAQAAHEFNEPVTASVDLAGESSWMTAVRTALHVDRPGESRQLVFMFEGKATAANWLTSSAMFGLLVLVLGVFAVEGAIMWLGENVVHPVQKLCDVDKKPSPDHCEQIQQRSSLNEIGQLARAFQNLCIQVSDARARIKKVEQTSRQIIDKSEDNHNKELQRAKDQATTDSLTRLRNRRFLEEELDSIFEGQRRIGRDFSIVMLDLDNFKHLNDTQGHKAGDELLNFTGALIRGAIRQEDYAIRYGGDEFALLLPDTSSDEAARVAERIVSLFRQYTAFVLTGSKQVTISAGVASLTQNPYASSGKALMARADEALYKSKHDGKCKVSTVAV